MQSRTIRVPIVYEHAEHVSYIYSGAREKQTKRDLSDRYFGGQYVGGELTLLLFPRLRASADREERFFKTLEKKLYVILL